jgi:hypothetical protein
MTTFILAFLVFIAIVAAMAIGVIFSNKPIKGSCGGMSALGIDTACDICGGNPQKCEDYNAQLEEEAENKASDLAYDASQIKKSG